MWKKIKQRMPMLGDRIKHDDNDYMIIKTYHDSYCVCDPVHYEIVSVNYPSIEALCSNYTSYTFDGMQLASIVVETRSVKSGSKLRSPDGNEYYVVYKEYTYSDLKSDCYLLDECFVINNQAVSNVCNRKDTRNHILTDEQLERLLSVDWQDWEVWCPEI